MIDITQIIVALIGLCSVIITAFAAPWFKAKLGETNYNKFLLTVDIIVDAAEQLGFVGQVQDKLDYAFNVVKQWLETNKMTVTDQDIYTAIEASVFRYNNGRIKDDTVQA